MSTGSSTKQRVDSPVAPKTVRSGVATPAKPSFASIAEEEGTPPSPAPGTPDWERAALRQLSTSPRQRRSSVGSSRWSSPQRSPHSPTSLSEGSPPAEHRQEKGTSDTPIKERSTIVPVTRWSSSSSGGSGRGGGGGGGGGGSSGGDRTPRNSSDGGTASRATKRKSRPRIHISIEADSTDDSDCTASMFIDMDEAQHDGVGQPSVTAAKKNAKKNEKAAGTAGEDRKPKQSSDSSDPSALVSILALHRDNAEDKLVRTSEATMRRTTKKMMKKKPATPVSSSQRSPQRSPLQLVSSPRQLRGMCFWSPADEKVDGGGKSFETGHC